MSEADKLWPLIKYRKEKSLGFYVSFGTRNVIEYVANRGFVTTWPKQEGEKRAGGQAGEKRHFSQVI